jgi:hypothetical protein
MIRDEQHRRELIAQIVGHEFEHAESAEFDWLEKNIPAFTLTIYENIIHNLPDRNARIIRLIEAMPVGSELIAKEHYRRFAAWMLIDPEHGLINSVTDEKIRNLINVIGYGFCHNKADSKEVDEAARAAMAAWDAWDARAAMAAWDARDARAARAAWDARDAEKFIEIIEDICSETRKIR